MDPISGYGDTYERWQRVEQESGPVKQAARDYCQHADSVISGFMRGWIVARADLWLDVRDLGPSASAGSGVAIP
jgi:hypothetical protein